jgi:hypothetical protein
MENFTSPKHTDIKFLQDVADVQVFLTKHFGLVVSDAKVTSYIALEGQIPSDNKTITVTIGHKQLREWALAIETKDLRTKQRCITNHILPENCRAKYHFDKIVDKLNTSVSNVEDAITRQDILQAVENLKVQVEAALAASPVNAADYQVFNSKATKAVWIRNIATSTPFITVVYFNDNNPLAPVHCETRLSTEANYFDAHRRDTPCIENLGTQYTDQLELTYFIKQQVCTL